MNNRTEITCVYLYASIDEFHAIRQQRANVTISRRNKAAFDANASNVVTQIANGCGMQKLFRVLRRRNLTLQVVYPKNVIIIRDSKYLIFVRNNR